MAIDELFFALAEPTRRRILEELRDDALAVGMLVERLEISQPTVSKHLKVLREAGLVTMSAQGQRRIYSLNLEGVDSLGRWCSSFLPEPEPVIEQQQAPATQVAVLEAANPAGLPAAAQQLSRTVGRRLEHVTGRAHEIIERFPRFGRKR